MHDILRPPKTPKTPDISVPEPPLEIAQQPIAGQPNGLEPQKKRNKKAKTFIIVATLSALLVGTVIGGLLWYNTQLSAVGSDKGVLKVVEVVSGSTPGQIAEQLEEQGIIRSSTAFSIYTKLSGTRDVLKAGTYRLSPAESTPQIVEHLVKGAVDEFSITFLPGATLADNRQVLIDAGYSKEAVDKALQHDYAPTSPILADRPAQADLEGYIYGETYNFHIGATAEDIIKRTLDEMHEVVTENNLTEEFKKQGLTLYEGITLASIVQREVGSANPNVPSKDQKQVAQVFYSRLAIDMQLGSDVTYQYIADKLGVDRDVNLDNPYNTRRYTGLPPGPIATPGLGALLAVAEPASTDYLYFLSGDDDVTYFARTNAEHEANIVNHCQIKCSTL
ncbi:MAG TPA: endolytic transglycosylase MltG [Candidatus Saccharimonadales bacterium]|nr:endolytic transglycosylase MltG [Candidatus Saccharimonadales bacterium]